jgi:hypothetical protein
MRLLFMASWYIGRHKKLLKKTLKNSAKATRIVKSSSHPAATSIIASALPSFQMLIQKAEKLLPCELRPSAMLPYQDLIQPPTSSSSLGA